MKLLNTTTKRFIAFALAVCILWQAVPMGQVKTYADNGTKMQFELLDNGETVRGAEIKATVSGADISFTYNENLGKYVSDTSVVSGNGLEGMYVFQIKAPGYEDVTRETELRYDEQTGVLEAGYDGMRQYKLYTVSGKVKKSNGSPLNGVTVTVAGENGKSLTVTTNHKGEYSTALTNGSYKLSFEKDGYVDAAKSFTVADGDMTVTDTVMSQAYTLTVNRDNNAYALSYKVYGTELPANGNVIAAEEGSSVVLTVNLRDNYRLTEEMEERMTTNAGEGMVDDGSSYSVSFNTLINWPQDNTYTIEYEEAVKAVIKYDGNDIYYCRNGHNGTVSVSGDCFSVTPDSEKYYIEQVEGGAVQSVSADGISETFRFKKGTPCVARVTVTEDTVAPDLEVSDEDGTLLKDKQLVDGAYQDGGEGNYWYINRNKTLYAEAQDGQTEIAEVTSKIEDSNAIKMTLTETPDLYSKIVEQGNISPTPTGSGLTVTATDRAGNSAVEQIQVFFDNEAPSVESVSLNGAEYVFVQNGITYIGGDKAEMEAVIKDSFGIKNI